MFSHRSWPKQLVILPSNSFDAVKNIYNYITKSYGAQVKTCGTKEGSAGKPKKASQKTTCHEVYYDTLRN